MTAKTSKDSGKKKERRKSQRYDRVKKISYKLLVPSVGEGFSQDFSEGGFSLFLDKNVPPGSVLELKFEKPGKDNKPEQYIVKVVWQKEYVAGVKILGKNR